MTLVWTRWPRSTKAAVPVLSWIDCDQNAPFGAFKRYASRPAQSRNISKPRTSRKSTALPHCFPAKCGRRLHLTAAIAGPVLNEGGLDELEKACGKRSGTSCAHDLIPERERQLTNVIASSSRAWCATACPHARRQRTGPARLAERDFPATWMERQRRHGRSAALWS